MINSVAQENTVNIFDPNAASTNYAPVTLTPSAIEHLKKKLKERGTGIDLRLSVKKAGCSGLEYVVDYVDAKKDKDYIFPVDAALAVYVDESSMPYVHGTKIDYVQKGIVGGVLKFINPNETGSCGCGESFSVQNNT